MGASNIRAPLATTCKGFLAWVDRMVQWASMCHVIHNSWGVVDQNDQMLKLKVAQKFPKVAQKVTTVV